MKTKSGFGILEVLIAAVVLGFMIIGVNALQSGNRESILRVRARDAANSIAQETIDSIGALGSAMVKEGIHVCQSCKTRSFSGTGVGDVKIEYNVIVDVKQASALQGVDNSTAYTRAVSAFKLKEEFAKQIDVTVNWKFKSSTQSINVSTVMR